MSECYDCGEQFAEDQLTYVDGISLCSSCYRAHAVDELIYSALLVMSSLYAIEEKLYSLDWVQEEIERMEALPDEEAEKDHEIIYSFLVFLRALYSHE